MPRMTTYERFFAKVKIREDGCWEWTGARLPAGYGIFADENGKTVTAHRWAYKHFKSPLIKPRYEISHFKCERRWCVNPKHLRQETHKQNNERRKDPAGLLKKPKKTHCPHGHDYSVYGRVRPHDGATVCKECERIGRLNRKLKGQYSVAA